MSAIDLKAYTTRAVKLESAIYTQEKLMKKYKKYLKSQRPSGPPKKGNKLKIEKPNIEEELNPLSAYEVPSLVAFIFLILNLFAYSNGGEWVSIAIPIIMIAIVLLLFIRAPFKAKEIKRKNIEIRKKNEHKTNLYNTLIQQQQEIQNRIDAKYEQEYAEFQLQVKQYREKTSVLMAPHKDLLKNLQDSLNEHYAQNVIYPKYRNMIAITTINEYLMSGRCYELEGPDGAYNLYEMELRQNIIVGQLSSIVNSLEEIKNNQYSLYQELVRANSTIDEILSEVKDVEENTRMTAYFAGVTSLIEASPKTYIGHTF